MSTPLGEISATVTICDFANIDASGKVNIIGGGVTLLGFEVQQGTTAPFAVFVRLTSPRPTMERPAVEIVLVDASGEPVGLPGPSGEPQFMRIAQNVDFPAPGGPGLSIPPGAVPSAAQFCLNFSNGLPLVPGHSYGWRVQVDHDVIASESFYVPTALPAPVIG